MSDANPSTETFTVFLDRIIDQGRRDDLAVQIRKLPRVERAVFRDPQPSFGHMYKLEVRYHFPVGTSPEEAAARMPGVTKVQAADGRIIDGTPPTPEQRKPTPDPDDDGTPIPEFRQCRVILSHTVPHESRAGYGTRISHVPGVLSTRFEDAAAPFKTLRKITVNYAEGHDVPMKLKAMTGVSAVHADFQTMVDAKLDDEGRDALADRIAQLGGVLRVQFQPVASPWATERPVVITHDCSNRNVERQVGWVPGVGPARKLAAGG